mmetsp:Transcript_98791/g.282424  ORF Transcript_98791/g.282424 Transcript_98791/m.282424 type:complete len:95 (-) Transcript_98791:2109-2393(-)
MQDDDVHRFYRQFRAQSGQRIAASRAMSGLRWHACNMAYQRLRAQGMSTQEAMAAATAEQSRVDGLFARYEQEDTRRDVDYEIDYNFYATLPWG